MTDSNYGGARRPANWGFFLLVSIGIGILVAIIEWALTTYAGINLPGIVTNLATAVIVTWIAGAAWLRGNGGSWTQEDRARLALAYTMVNLVCALLLFGGAFALMSSPMGQEIFAAMGLTPEMLAAGGVMIGVVLVVAIPIGLAIGYGIQRLVLYYLVGKGETARAQADTFS